MSDYLDRIPDEGKPKFPEKDPAAEAYEHYIGREFEEYVKRNTQIDFGVELPLPTEEEETEIENCCGDAEYCVQASCVVCPECQGFETIRTTLPNEDNVSEFECLECECFFTAINP